MNNLKKINYEEFINDVNQKKVVAIKEKRERAVYYVIDDNMFFKVWVPNWSQSKIANYCIEKDFYNEKNADSIYALLEDETGPRGYVQKAGESAAEPGKSDKSWDYFVKKTNKSQRYNFIKEIFEKSIEVQGTYTDLAPCNLIFFNDKINFIDLESFRSFDLIFDKKRRDYENFDLNAWWKPHETAKRDVNRYLKSYLKDCLDIEIDYEIDSLENFKKTLEVLNGNK